jgi:hypothetical protein
MGVHDSAIGKPGIELFGTPVKTVFGLAGMSENSATAAISWGLAQSPGFLSLLLRNLGFAAAAQAGTAICLQRSGQGGGFTDIELVVPDQCHVILEAKKGWVVPSLDQLGRYANRLKPRTPGSALLASVSAADERHAASALPKRIKDVGVLHRSWSTVLALAKQARTATSSPIEKVWLSQVIEHLSEFAQMQNPTDNTVYVVSLSSTPIRAGARYTWIDVIERDRNYFHPIKAGWPVVPPNYLGFRYRGMLQSVHHVDDVRVVRNLRQHNPSWPATDADHFVYRLGPPMRPTATLPNGPIYPSGRLYCALDTLLSGACATVATAAEETKRRVG